MSVVPTEPPAASDHQQIAWQFDAPDLAAVGHWLAARADDGSGVGVSARAGPTLELRDTYFDTDDWRIARAGYTLRIRDTGDWREATLNGRDEAVDGLRRQQALSEPLTPDVVTPAAAPGPVGALVRQLASGQSLHALVTLTNHRRVFRLAVNAIEAGEATLDETLAVRPDGSLARLERVAVAATPALVGALEGFVGELCAACALRPASVAKVAFGLVASGRTPPPSLALGDTTVSADMAVGAFALALLRRQFAALLAQEAGTRAGDAEALHQMRVATRRLRALLTLFVEALPVRASAWRRELGWLGQALGAVRDRDVHIAALRRWPDGADAAEVAVIIALVEEERTVAVARLRRALASRRYQRLVASGLSLALSGPARRSPAARAPADTALPPLIERRYRTVRRAARAITPDAPPAAYHRLRLEAKRLRYTVEPAVALYGKPARRLARRLTALQDLLGEHQDAAVAVERFQAYRDRGGRRITPRVAFLLGRMAATAEGTAARARADFPPTFATISGRPWKRLRRAMAEKG